MLKYMGKRLLMLIPTLFGVITLVFLMIALSPGDPARVMLGERANSEQLAKLRKDLDLDKPLVNQYFNYLGRIVRFDFGKSIKTGQKVTEEIGQRLPATIELAFFAMIIAVISGIILGVAAAKNKNSLVDYTSMVGSLVGVSMPVFWLALVMIMIFSVGLDILPSGGRMNVRTTRSSMLEVLKQDYIKTARAAGINENKIIYHYALKNALLPVLTVIGIQFGLLLSGAILTETIFAWPGIGKWLYNAIEARDYPAVQGGIIIVSIIFVLINMVVDILYSVVNPRIRLK